MGASAEAGLNATQAAQVRQMIVDIAREAHDEAIKTARQSLEATRDTMMQTADEFARNQDVQRAEHQRITEELATRQRQIEASLEQASEKFAGMELDIAHKQETIGKIVEELGKHSAQKERIIEDLDVKQKAMEALSENVQKTIFEQAGGWK